MTTLQVLVRHRHDGADLNLPTVETVLNEQQLPPDAFDNDNQHALPIGSEGLVELAFALQRSANYRVTDLSLVDFTFTRVDGEWAEAVKSALIAALRKPTDRDAFDILNEVAPTLYVLNIELRDLDGSGRITIHQDGVLTTQSARQAEILPDLIGRVLPPGIAA